LSRFLLSLTLLAMVLAPLPAQAQSDLRLDQVSVQVWPEYDQPLVLVIYRLSLAPETTLPVTLRLRVPATAQLNAVAEQDPGLGLLNALYERTVEGEWATLAISANQLELQVEYYDRLPKYETERSIVYQWAGDYPVEDLAVHFLEPAGSEDLEISPRPAKAEVGQDGLTNHIILAGGLEAGRSFTVTISYRRQTDDLSITSLPVQAASTPGADTPGRVDMTGILPWLLGAGGVLLLGGAGGLLIWQRGARPARRARRLPRRERKPSGEAVYCHHCGKRAQQGDVFCRTCGTRLRRQ
jgi:hypothetical protein